MERGGKVNCNLCRWNVQLRCECHFRNFLSARKRCQLGWGEKSRVSETVAKVTYKNYLIM